VKNFGAPADFHPHAWRHTIATFLKKRGVSKWERGLVLNHSESGVTADYSHGYPIELKLQLLTTWAEQEGLVKPYAVRVSLTSRPFNKPPKEPSRE
jgi:integrase